MNEIAGSGTRPQAGPPSPSTDRAALSEAWYRALYATKPSTREAHAVPAAAQSRAGAAAPTARPGYATAPAASRSRLAAPPNSATAERGAPAIASVSRFRPNRESLTQPAAPRTGDTVTARRTVYRVATPEGHVEVLVQQRGRRLHVVALSEGAAANRVASALQRARAAILTHGLRLEIDLRSKGAT